MFLEDFFDHKIQSIKFMQIFANGQGTFFPVFLHFLLLLQLLTFECVTAIWNVAIKQFECSIATEYSKWEELHAKRFRIQPFLYSTIVNDF